MSTITRDFSPTVPPIHEVTIGEPLTNPVGQSKYAVNSPVEQESTCQAVCCCCCNCFANIASCWAQMTFQSWEWQQGREMSAQGAQNGNVGEQIGGQYLMYDSGGLFGLCFPRAQDAIAADVMGVNHQAASCCCSVLQRIPEVAGQVPGCLSQTLEVAGNIAEQVPGCLGQTIEIAGNIIECVAGLIPR